MAYPTIRTTTATLRTPSHTTGASLPRRSPSWPATRRRRLSLNEHGRRARTGAGLPEIALAHPKSPPFAVAAAARDRDRTMRQAAAASVACPVAAMIKLSRDSSYQVRAALAANPSVRRRCVHG